MFRFNIYVFILGHLSLFGDALSLLLIEPSVSISWAAVLLIRAYLQIYIVIGWIHLGEKFLFKN